MKKITKFMTLGLAILLAGCTSNTDVTTDQKDGNGQESGTAVQESDVLRMGIMQGKSEIPVIIAKEMGYFDEVGLNVEITSFQGPNYRDAAVQAGEVDGVITDIMTVLNYNQNGFPMVMTADMNEDFKLIAAAGKNMQEPADFEGEKMVVAKNYLTHYVLDVIAEEEDFDYTLEAIPQFPARMEALKNGLVGGAVLGQPQAGMMEADGVRIIADAESDYGIEIGAIAFGTEFVKNNPTNLNKFYEAYNMAIDYLNATPAEEYVEIIENYGIASTIAPYLNTEEGKFEYAKTFSEEQFEDVLNWTMENGLITEEYTFEELTDFSYIQ